MRAIRREPKKEYGAYPATHPRDTRLCVDGLGFPLFCGAPKKEESSAVPMEQQRPCMIGSLDLAAPIVKGENAGLEVCQIHFENELRFFVQFWMNIFV